MKSEITLSKLSPLRLSMSKISFSFFSKIFSPKLLFVFSFVLVFSFTQVNFSGAQSAGSDGKCYTLAAKFVDSLGIIIPKNQEASCVDKNGGSITPAQITQNIKANGGTVTPSTACYKKGDGTIVDDETKTKIIPILSCSSIVEGVNPVNSPANQANASAQAAIARAETGNDVAQISPCTKVEGAAAGIGCEIWYAFSKFMLQVSAEILNLAGKFFDYTTQKFVLQISTMFQDVSGKDKAYIYGAWSVIRDLANIAAFFGAVYTGFRYITGSDSLDFKKAVTKLILYSILVNFSFPIAKFLIDISNIISLQIYGGISEYKIGDNVLSRNLLSTMNLNSLVSQVGAANPDFKGFTSFSLMWLAIIYLLSAFFAFLYAGIMILVRSFILLACVILSPLMFLNFAFPKLTELHEKWRENFFGQLVFAPVLMFGFWLSFILLQAAFIPTGTAIQTQGNVQQFSSNANGLLFSSESECRTACIGGSCAYEGAPTRKYMCTAAGAVPAASGKPATVPSYSDVGALINMLMAILSLFLTVKLAGSVSGGAGKSISGMVGGGMKGLGLAVATGGTGLLARATMGRAGAMMANSKWVQNTGPQNGASRRMAASLASNAGNKMSSFKLAGTKSFDEKKIGNLKSDRDKMNAENGQQIRKTGMSDLIAQAKTPEQLKLAKDEMARISSDPNYKRNDDLFGNKAKQKAFELGQSDLKSVKDNNVGFFNQGEYKNELVNKRRLESGTVSKLRDERLKKRDEGRQENLNKAQTEADVEKAFGKIVESDAKTFDTGAEREEKFIEKSENKIESLKNTSLSAALRSKKSST